MREPDIHKVYKSGNSRGLWVKISSIMTEAGFNLGPKTREKISNKWGALLKSVRTYKCHINQTGNGTKDKPPFFDDVIDIEGDSHSICPPVVLDSFDIPSSSGSVPVEAEIIVTKKLSPTLSLKKVDDKHANTKEAAKQSSRISLELESVDDFLPSEPEGIDSDKASPRNVLPGKSKTRYSMRKEHEEFLKQTEQKQQEREQKKEQHNAFVREHLKHEKKRADKLDEMRAEEISYRRNRDKKAEEQTDRFLALFGALVANKPSKYDSDSDSEDDRKSKRQRKSN